MNDNDAIREPSPTVQHMGIETSTLSYTQFDRLRTD